jgi:iron(III) transport system permease protein
MRPSRLRWPAPAWLVLLASVSAGLVVATASATARQAVIQSVILAAAVTGVAVPLGTLLAVLVVRTALPGRRAAAWLIVMLVLTPLHVHLAGWDAALGKLGWWTLSLGQLDRPLLAGIPGAIVVHAAAAVAWVAVIVAAGLVHLPVGPEEAAWTSVPPWVVLRRITLPQVRPLVQVAALYAALSTTSDMTVTNVYLVHPSEQTATERFYMAFAMEGEAGPALRSAWPALAVGIIAVGGMMWGTVPKVLRRSSLPGRPLVFPLGRWRWPLAAAAWLVLGALAGLPLVSLAIKAGHVVELAEGVRQRHWSAAACLWRIVSAPQQFAREGWDTLRVASGASVLALAAAAGLAVAWRRGGWARRLAGAVVLLALVTPGPLVGVALILLFNHDLPPHLPWQDGKSWLVWLYDDTPLVPMLAQAIRALPLASLLLGYSFGTLRGNLLAAAALDGASPWTIFWRILLPLRWRAVLAAGLVAWAVAAGDLAWSHLVTPPGLDLLQRRVFGLLHAGVEEQVAAITLVQLGLYAVVTLTIAWLVGQSGTHSPRTPTARQRVVQGSP